MSLEKVCFERRVPANGSPLRRRSVDVATPRVRSVHARVEGVLVVCVEVVKEQFTHRQEGVGRINGDVGDCQLGGNGHFEEALSFVEDHCLDAARVGRVGHDRQVDVEAVWVVELVQCS